MKRLSLICICVLQFFIFAYPTISATTSDETRTVILNKKTEDAPKTKFPKLPAYSPVYCMVAGNEIDVYCQYEATGDILVVDSRTGLTVASETGVELGEGYTLLNRISCKDSYGCN